MLVTSEAQNGESYRVDHALMPSAESLRRYAPSSPSNLVDLMRHLAEARTRACLRGGGCSTHGRSIAGPVQIQMTNFDELRVEEGYLIVGGGTRLKEVAACLRQAKAWLPVLPSSPKATLGGALAAGGFGPASLRRGGLFAALEEVTIATPTKGVLRAARNDDPLGVFALVPGSLGALGPVIEAKFLLDPTMPQFGKSENQDTRPLLRIAQDLIAGPSDAALLVSNDLEKWRVQSFQARVDKSDPPIDLHSELHARETAYQDTEARWLKTKGLRLEDVTRLWVDFMVPLERLDELQAEFSNLAHVAGAFQVFNAMVFDAKATASALHFPFLPLAGEGASASLGTYITLERSQSEQVSSSLDALRAKALDVGGRQYLHGPHPTCPTFFEKQFGRSALTRLDKLRRKLGVDVVLDGF